MNSGKGMIYSIVLKLTPTREVTLGATMGHQVHAAFLRTLQEADPELAAALHAPDQPVRPFTVSPLRGVSRAREGQVRLSPGRDCWLRFTVLQTHIFERFMTRFLQPALPVPSAVEGPVPSAVEGPVPSAVEGSRVEGPALPVPSAVEGSGVEGSRGRLVIRLGRAELLIREVLATPGAHSWSGYTTWAELTNQARLQPEITLHFVSPTAFGFGQKEWGKKVVVLPEPEPVFGSLLRSWNNLAPPPLQVDRDALMSYVEEHVVIKRLRGLETQMLRFRRSPQVGFVGRVAYGLMADNEAARCQLNTLADFAFYAGVGMKTTMGMGQCRRMTNDQ